MGVRKPGCTAMVIRLGLGLIRRMPYWAVPAEFADAVQRAQSLAGLLPARESEALCVSDELVPGGAELRSNLRKELVGPKPDWPGASAGTKLAPVR